VAHMQRVMGEHVVNDIRQSHHEMRAKVIILAFG
jgi:hypothetical protein